MKDVLAFLGGVAVGAAVALLMAPEKGEITRYRIKRAFEDKVDDLKDELRQMKKNVCSEIEI